MNCYELGQTETYLQIACKEKYVSCFYFIEKRKFRKMVSIIVPLAIIPYISMHLSNISLCKQVCTTLKEEPKNFVHCLNQNFNIAMNGPTLICRFFFYTIRYIYDVHVH